MPIVYGIRTRLTAEAPPVLIRKPSDIPSSEITPFDVYVRRREFLAGALTLGALAALPGSVSAAALEAIKSPLSTDEKVTKQSDATSYNNFYEFGVNKSDPAANAGSLKTSPW